MSSTPIFDQTQVQFTAIAISLVTNQAYSLSIDRFETHKSDDSSAGTWSCSGPLQQGSNTAYASVMSPMDIIAIYASRSSQLDGTSMQLGPPNTQNSTASQGPLLAGLQYGVSGVGMTALLNSPSCVFIGMLGVGGAEVSIPNASLELEGLDFTKVFLSNDTFIPWDAYTASLWSGASQMSLPGQSSTNILFILFDVWVAKSSTAFTKATSSLATIPIPAGGFAPTPTTLVGPLATAGEQTEVDYGYPWRDFIDTSLLDVGFLAFPPGTYPPYLVQTGASVWASAMELKNAPLTRLFVNEIGQMVHDDQKAAWISQTPKAKVYGDEILSFRTSVDDTDLMTNVSIYGNLQANLGVSAQILGSPGAMSHFDPGTSNPSLLIGNVVRTFGLRQVQWKSLYDSTPAQVQQRKSILTLKYNILTRARATIRGTTAFKVGDRVTFFAPGFNPACTNATWYVVSMSQSADFSQSTWSTTVDLMYPTQPDPPPIVHPQARAS